MLLELARREKISGIKPDGDLDIFMKVRVLIQYVDSFIHVMIADTLFSSR